MPILKAVVMVRLLLLIGSPVVGICSLACFVDVLTSYSHGYFLTVCLSLCGSTELAVEVAIVGTAS